MDPQTCNFLCFENILSRHLIRHSKEWGDIKGHSRGSTSLIVKPLSAITQSPFSKGSLRKPLRSTISLSDILPVYSCLMNVIDPLVEIPISPFRVVWLLYELNSSLFNKRLLGIWHRTSVQSIITLVLGYFCLKASGILFWRARILSGQVSNTKKLIQEKNILLTVDCDTLKCARWTSAKPCLSLHITKKNSSRSDKVLGLPCLTELPTAAFWESSWPDNQYLTFFSIDTWI